MRFGKRSGTGKGAAVPCLCLTAPTFDGALEQLERYRGCIGMAEMRADLLLPEERPRIVGLPEAAGPGLPLILTARLPEDGGFWGRHGEGSVEREEFLTGLLESGGWSFVDLEHDRPMERVASAATAAGCRVIRSLHDFRGTILSSTTEEIASIIRRLADDGSVAKMAVLCRGSRALLKLAKAADAAGGAGEKVVLGMGDFGTPSRILAQRLGSVWTYASSIGSSGSPPAAAPGQIDPATLENLYRFSEIGEGTPLYGIAGNPVSHSKSPEIHNSWLRKAGLPGTYLPFLTDDLDALLEVCEMWGVSGLSVTVPHKETALAASGRAAPPAGSVGAANTLIRVDGAWEARNTDAAGFLAPLPAALGLGGFDDLKGLRAAVIGAGGAARAAVHALAGAGVHVIVLNRTISKAEALAREVGGAAGPLSEKALPLLSDVELVVQTTTAGMHPDPEADPAPWWDFSGCSLVYDLIYAPEETVLLRRAREAGVPTLNGAGMLEEQARIQFELFTGYAAP